MPFIGNQPALSYTSFAKQDFTTSATTSYTLDNPVANANELALFINFVRQEPTTAYSASGTTLTLTSATSASDDMYCVYLGKAVQTVNPPNASVGTSQLSSTLDFSSKTITLASNMKNTPNFLVALSADQTISTATQTKVQVNSEEYDTDSIFDSTTNYRATIPTGYGGKWCFYYNLIGVAGTNNLNEFQAYIRKNGTIFTQNFCTPDVNELNAMALYESIIIDCVAGDYFELWGYINDLSGSPNFRGKSGSYLRTYFGGYKIIE